MSTKLVAFFSAGGRTAKVAAKLAGALSADLVLSGVLTDAKIRALAEELGK